MTSKNLFCKLIKQDIRKRIWYPIIIFISLFIFLEVPLLMTIDNMTKSGNRYEYSIFTFVKDYFFGTYVYPMTIVFCAAAVLSGISGYAYLYSKAQVDTYHSLPVSRSQLFWSRFISGIMQFFIPFIIHILICAGIAANKNAFGTETVSCIIFYLGIALVVYILAYSTAIIAVGLTGNIIIGILGTAVLFIYSTMISLIVFTLYNKFFDTYVVYALGKMTNFINGQVSSFSPLSMILKLFSYPDKTLSDVPDTIFKYDESYIKVMVIAAIIYSIAAYIICLKRASEAAGKAIAFHSIEPVIKTMLVIPASFYGGILFSEISGSSSSNSKWFIFGLAFSFVIVCILIEIIFRMDLRGAFMHK